METRVTSSGRAGSISSISTRSSRASEGLESDVERGEKTATRISHRTDGFASVNDNGGHIAALQSHRELAKPKRVFKGRHIQMMAIGIPLRFDVQVTV
jgi:amino acid permease